MPSALWQGIILIAVPALALVGLQFYSASSLDPQLRQGAHLIARTLQAIDSARAVDLAVSEAERDQFGFFITGNPSYVAQYQGATRQALARISSLHKLWSDNTEQVRRIALLSSAVEVKFAELQLGIDARQKLGFTAAHRSVEENLRPDTRHVITGIIETVITNENHLLADQESRLLTVQAAAERTDRIAIVLTLSLMLLGAVLLRRALAHDAHSLARLRESEERFRLLISGVRDYAIFMLDPQGYVASWNEGAQRIKGYTPAEAIGLHVSQFYSPEEGEARASAQHTLEKAAQDGSIEVEGWRRRKDGSRFYANVAVTALRSEDGSLRGFAKVTRDVTERRRQQSAIEESRAALAQAQKMEAMGQLTGGLAHDFNNFLSVIIGAIDLVLRRGGPVETEKTTQLLDTAKEAALQGASLVRRLLAFARRQSLEPKPVNVNELAANVSRMLRSTLGSDIRLETIPEPDIWLTLVDPNQLETALLNLCLNARDAMPNGGKLAIETHNVELNEPSGTLELAPGQYVLLSVGDDGEGMTVETLARAFEPFYTTKPAGKGTGLGLSQVHGFVRQSGGNVRLESAVGNGTTVKVYLPRFSAEPEPGMADGP
ncbi:MAG TPA: PAS domain S-box protein [Rhizomicrobium sp.]